jgi:hypothetical protein
VANVLIDYSPRPYFLPFHERHQRFACIVAHRGAGKTTACMHELQRAAATKTTERPRFAYIAPLLKQAKAVAWDTLKAAVYPLKEYGAQVNEAELRVDYPNGGQVRLFGADNPDSLRGIHLDGVVIDEPAQIDPTLWEEVVSPALAARKGWAVFIGTPKGRDGFYKRWAEALSNPALWYAVKLPASKTGALSEKELAEQRATKSESQYAREYECSFDEPAVNQFILSAEADAARKRMGVGTGPRLLGIDVARHGDDRTVAVFRNGDRIEPEWISVWRGLDLMQTAARVAEMIEQLKPRLTFVDGVGVGGGVVDRLRQLGYKVVDVNGGSTALKEERFVNLRAEMWSKMRDWLRDKGGIPDRDDLANDLMAPTYEFDHRNRLKLEKKEDMKARGLPSPDIADALALTFSRPVAAEQPWVVDRAMGQVGLQWRTGMVPDENPLAGL